jgi:hypothetical protein
MQTMQEVLLPSGKKIGAKVAVHRQDAEKVREGRQGSCILPELREEFLGSYLGREAISQISGP